MRWRRGHGLALAAAVGLGLAAACALPRRPQAPPLRVGTTGDYAPFSLARGGAFEGLDIEVAGRFARDLGRELVLVAVRWADLGRDLAGARFDVAMGGVTVRPERALQGTFTRPVAETGAVVLVAPTLARTREEVDRPSVRLAVNAGGHLEQVARRLLPRASLVPSADNRALPGLVLAGAADAVLTDDVEAQVFAPSLPALARIGPLTRDRKAYLARDPALAARLDAWLRAREADGTLDRLRARWLGAATPLRAAFDSDVAAVLCLIDLRLAFMPAVAAAKESAGRPVADPDQEARVLASVRARAGERELPADAVERLFRAQLDAARSVQRAFLDTPPDHRPPVPTLDLERQARPALARISAAIVDRAAELASDRARAPLDPHQLAASLDPSLVLADARVAIAGALVRVVENQRLSRAGRGVSFSGPLPGALTGRGGP
jgi:cyclohexadienyl dehydratase